MSSRATGHDVLWLIFYAAGNTGVSQEAKGSRGVHSTIFLSPIFLC
jgi:hypothetical protein